MPTYTAACCGQCLLIEPFGKKLDKKDTFGKSDPFLRFVKTAG